MRCEQIMKRNVKCVSPRDTVEDVARRMRDDNIGFMPVCDQSRKTHGTLTDRDLAIRVLADHKPASTLVEDVMTREVISCRPEDDIDKAAQLMARSHKSRIICVDKNGSLVGVISLSDIAQHATGPRATDILRQISEREARV